MADGDVITSLNRSATFEHDVRRCAKTQTFAHFKPQLRAVAGIFYQWSNLSTSCLL